jgi:hypothetical protein
LKLLLNFLVSIVVTVISACVVRRDASDGARVADAPLSFVGAVVERIGKIFDGVNLVAAPI